MKTRLGSKQKKNNNSTERMRKHRDRKRHNENFDIEKHREMERKRITKLRKSQKEERERDNDSLMKYRSKERLRKREQRAEIKKKVQEIKQKEESKRKKSRAYVNKGIGRNLKRRFRAEKEEKIKDLEFKVKMLKNANRNLKRKLGTTSLESNVVENILYHSSDDSNEGSPTSSILESVSPTAKKRALRRLKLNPPNQKSIKRKLRFDKVHVESGRKSTLKMKIEIFLLQDENSVVVPDIKKSKKGIRYRLMTLEDLHQKFVVDEELECSYPQFTRHVPGYIIKPKPEDWGTCLCKTCLNPELKLAVIKRLYLKFLLNFKILKKKNAKMLLIICIL
ncbi:unnamed protein product [Meganyctiphanes norvegica]|uniref:Uncharacterized protein n=1 Tax=Meganyctiphanes norvegica TaxID=48144 RepID=A0AAV2QLD1_MEGNR